MKIKRINDSDLRLLYDNMIVQENNLNSYSMVSILNDEVYKIYIREDFKSKQNIKIVKKEFAYSYLRKFEELVLPNSIIKYNNHIVGFTMPYINGVTLSKLYKQFIYNFSNDTRKSLFLPKRILLSSLTAIQVQ